MGIFAFQSNVGLGYRWRAQRNEQETNDQAHVPLHLCLFVPRFHRSSYSRTSSPRDRVGFRITWGNHPRIWVALCESFRDRNPLQPQDAAALQRTVEPAHLGIVSVFGSVSETT